MQNKNLGIVIIGRNEDSRLADCFNSVGTEYPVVYVDSGSTDNSIEIANSSSVIVHQLDSSLKLSAARARNEGFDLLTTKFPDLEYVHFIDGDCVIEENWFENALKFIEADPKLAIVTGRVKERYPELSIYNRLCQIEWDQPSGEVTACGGIFLCRVKAYSEVSGFDLNYLAGEEPELCSRLIQNGWKIHRLDRAMCKHDTGIVTLAAFLRRIERSGYAAAYGFLHKHGNYNLRQVFSIVFWGLLLPGSLILALLCGDWFVAIILLILALQIFRVFLRYRHYGFELSFAYALQMVLGKPFEFFGLLSAIFRGTKFNYQKN